MKIIEQNLINFTEQQIVYKFVQQGARVSDVSGGGDMTKAVYDPNTVNDDAFDMSNMSEGATNKILTATERTKLTGIETGAEVNNVTDTEAAGISGGNSPSATNVVETRNESSDAVDVIGGGTKTLDVTGDNVFVITTDDTAFTIATSGQVNSRGITLIIKFTAALPTITWPTLANTAPDISGATATTGKAVIEMLYVDSEWWAWLVDAI